MDDKKVLILVSKESIPMTLEIRMILQISNLKSATPATKYRFGLLFINDSYFGWKPYFESWLTS